MAWIVSERRAPASQLSESRIQVRSGFLKLIVGRLIRLLRSRRLRGHRVVGLIGGSRSGSSGWVACGAQTAVNGGSELLIFVPRTGP